MRTSNSRLSAQSRYLTQFNRLVGWGLFLYRVYRVVEILAEVVGPFIGYLG